MPRFPDLIACLLLLSPQVTGASGGLEVGDLPGPFGLEEITGPFHVEAIARFDNLSGDLRWQRIFDFGNGPEQDNIVMGQLRSSNDMVLDCWIDGTMYRVIADDAIVEGETATWAGGVTSYGTMWIQKDGGTLTEAHAEAVPKNVIRANKLIGRSNWEANSALEGAVLGIVIGNEGETPNKSLMNIPAQIHGGFTMEFVARFDKLEGRKWQRIFDFGNGPTGDNVLVGQCYFSNDMCFNVWRSGEKHEVRAIGAITEGETASWRVGITDEGGMWMEKNCTSTWEDRDADGLPANVPRSNLLIGESNWPSDVFELQGFVLGLRVWQSPTAAPPSPSAVVYLETST